MGNSESRARSREMKIKTLEEEVRGYKAFLSLAQAYVACLISEENGGHVEVPKSRLKAYIDRPELIQTRIVDGMYVIDVKKPE